MTKRFLFVNRRAPHGTSYAHEALDMVLAAAAFEQEVSLAFLDDGVYQLLKHQRTASIGTRNFSDTYRALKEYDVNNIYVEHESLEARGLRVEDLLIDAVVLKQSQMTEFLEKHDVIVSF